MHPDDLGRVRNILDESARRMIPWRGEFRYRNPSLGEIWVEGNLIPIAEPDGAVLWQDYIADITEGLCPELQRRGLIRTHFTHQHFRDNMRYF